MSNKTRLPKPLWYLDFADKELPTFSQRCIEKITRAEREVMQVVAGGRNAIGSANYRGVSEDTVRKQLQSIYAKLSVNDRAQLTHAAIQMRLPLVDDPNMGLEKLIGFYDALTPLKRQVFWYRSLGEGYKEIGRHFSPLLGEEGVKEHLKEINKKLDALQGKKFGHGEAPVVYARIANILYTEAKRILAQQQTAATETSGEHLPNKDFLPNSSAPNSPDTRIDAAVIQSQRSLFDLSSRQPLQPIGVPSVTATELATAQRVTIRGGGNFK